MEKKFKDLAIGEEFDWINDKTPEYNSFFLRCWRNTYRGYVDENGTQHHVRTITAPVYHCSGEIVSQKLY